MTMFGKTTAPVDDRLLDADGLFSADPETQAVELAFLRRLNAENHAFSVAMLDEVRSGRRANFAQTYQAMQSPIFEKLLRLLERALPLTARFGRFRDRGKRRDDP
jgi:hypothetical protein